ncbi:MAG: tRNA (adenosine(37)-N6)-threonylcarbamoyltransferase complex ATPase subunit type 1 TsaE, partial [Clostridium baratii]|nr:tRNA (adenosine(37)-N6)-threonylcarbamoyltransferase complex ATPase subunit type 1 TsaE [Clostridium baratii]
IYAIGFDDYIFSDAVSIIAWANYIEEILPNDFLHIYIQKDLSKGENYRKITLTPYGEKYQYIKELSL